MRSEAVEPISSCLQYRDEKAQESPLTDRQTALSQWLDQLRWIAAFCVVLQHCANRFFEQYAKVDAAHSNLGFSILTFLSGYAHESVMIFFVLSGYLVGGGLWRDVTLRDQVDIPTYLVKRVSRLCIVYYPALFAILIFNLAGVYVFDGIQTGVYKSSILSTMRPAAALCNAAFLQTTVCKAWGDNGALWSLSNEFWYYMVWPLILIGFVGRAKRRYLYLAAAALLLLSLGLIQTRSLAVIVPYLVIWIFGVAVAVLERPIVPSASWSAALFLTWLIAERILLRRSLESTNHFAQFVIDVCTGGLFASLLVSMRHCESLIAPVGRSWNTTIAAFSFSLYCIHIPVLNLYGAGLRYFTGTGWLMAPDQLWTWNVVFGGIAVSYTAAYGFSRLTEARTEGLRKYLLCALKWMRGSKRVAIHSRDEMRMSD